uniref:Uncharacterized protein n=1 Tax=Arundo donax TaxID=35708 RepID=A0A0A8ZR11_ARUDO
MRICCFPFGGILVGLSDLLDRIVSGGVNCGFSSVGAKRLHFFTAELQDFVA